MTRIDIAVSNIVEMLKMLKKKVRFLITYVQCKICKVCMTRIDIAVFNIVMGEKMLNKKLDF